MEDSSRSNGNTTGVRNRLTGWINAATNNNWVGAIMRSNGNDILVGVVIVVAAAWVLWVSDLIHNQAITIGQINTSMEYIKDKVDVLDETISTGGTIVVTKTE